MNSLPLHPAIVHLPLGLAILMPLMAAGFAWALWSGRVRPRAWIAVVALQALLVGSGMVAMNTGEAEEDRVESVVQKSAIHQHEEFAEQFVWSAGGTLVLAGLVLVFRQARISRGLAAAAVVATVAVAGLALRVGHAGGQLVYAHGAASAYAGVAKTSSSKPSTAAPGPRERKAVDADDSDEVR
jgi:uncharacterized membrane protein